MRYYRLRSQLPTNVGCARSCFDKDRITEVITEVNTDIDSPLHNHIYWLMFFFFLLIG